MKNKHPDLEATFSGKKNLSSALSSWLIKILVGATFLIWTVLFFGEFLAREIIAMRKSGSASADFLVAFIILVLLVLALVICPSPKKVSVDAENIYVSNLFKEITILKSNVKTVEESILSHPKYLTIHLQNKTEFGKEIIFLPQNGSFWKSSQKIIDLIQKK